MSSLLLHVRAAQNQFFLLGQKKTKQYPPDRGVKKKKLKCPFR